MKYYVTNLNNSGKNSFRNIIEIISQTSNNTSSNTNTVNQTEEINEIFFNISGIIKLKSKIKIQNEHRLIIYGESSPGEGITLLGGIEITNCSNINIRYLRIRNLNYTYANTVTIRDSVNIIFRNMTISNGDIFDMAIINSTQIYSLNCIIGHTNNNKRLGSTINIINSPSKIAKVTFIGCLFAFTKGNLPRVTGNIELQIRDNMIFDKNPDSSLPLMTNIELSIQKHSICSADNVFWRTKSSLFQYDPENYKMRILSPMTINKNDLLEKLNHFLNNVGTSFPNRDIQDNLLISDILNLTECSRTITNKNYSLKTQKRKYNEDFHTKKIVNHNKYITEMDLIKVIFPKV